MTITVNGQVLPSEAIDEAREVEEMLMLMDIDIASYRIGLTQVSAISSLVLIVCLQLGILQINAYMPVFATTNGNDK